MSYGHADKLARSGKEPSEQSPPADQSPADQSPAGPAEGEPAETTKAGQLGDLAPDWYDAPELARVLINHDIGALYRWLNDAGVPQRQIALLTGTTQSQVSDILAGRRVKMQVYAVLVRTAEGLGIPRERMGLSWWGPDGRLYGPGGAYPRGVQVAHTPKVVTAEMYRRNLIAWGGVVIAGAPVEGIGELLTDLGDPPLAALPSRIEHVHVAQVKDVTQFLAKSGMAFGADPGMSSTAATRADRLLKLPCTEAVKRAMQAAVAGLHITAGCAAFDSGLYELTMYHLSRAMELASQAKDPYLQALALKWAGAATVEAGHPNDALKMLQASQVATWAVPADHDWRAAVEACAVMESAAALTALGEPKTADRYVATSRDLWTPTRADSYGDLDLFPALLEIDRGRLDRAEQFAVASVRRWEGISQRARTTSGVVLATVYVKAGEQRGLQLAHKVITDVSKLTSVRVRRRLVPLVTALEARPGPDAKSLARMARRLAT